MRRLRERLALLIAPWLERPQWELHLTESSEYDPCSLYVSGYPSTSSTPLIYKDTA